MMSSRALFWPGVLVAAGLLSMPGAARLSGQTGQAPADQGQQQQPPAAPTTPPAPVTPLPSQDGVAQPAPPAQRPSFRAGVELVSINVTVTDPGGRYLTELNQPDFQVFEDGAQQQVTFFNRTNLPIALSILLDTSASMESRLETAQEAAIGFVRRLRPQDLAQVVDFDSRVQVVQGFTNSVADLEGAIRRTNAGGSTSLHNAIYIALKELKRTQARGTDEIRRQAIVVLSDGEDTSSLVSFDEVLDLAKRSETAIYAIGLRSRDACSSPARSQNWRACTGKSPTSCRASTRWGTPRAIPSVTAPGGASSCASLRRTHLRAPSRGTTLQPPDLLEQLPA
jgi:hypothetical protein